MDDVKNILKKHSELNNLLEDNPINDKFEPIAFEKLMSMQFQDVEWLIESLITSDGVFALSGAPASYKTWFILELVLSVAGGTPLFNHFKTQQGGVLFIDEENGERTIQTRFKKLNTVSNLPIYLTCLNEYRLVSKMVNKLILFCKENKIKLVVFDSLVRIHGSEENSATEMAKVARLLKRIAKQGIAVLFTHHNRKPGIKQIGGSNEMRGSSDILASVDGHLTIDRKNKDTVIKVDQKKMRQAPEIDPFKLCMIETGEKISLEYLGEEETRLNIKDEYKKIIVSTLKDKTLSKTALYEAIGDSVKGGYSTFRIAIQEMVEGGNLFEQKGYRNQTLCSLIPFEHEGVLIE